MRQVSPSHLDSSLPRLPPAPMSTPLERACRELSNAPTLSPGDPVQGARPESKDTGVSVFAPLRALLASPSSISVAPCWLLPMFAVAVPLGVLRQGTWLDWVFVLF